MKNKKLKITIVAILMITVLSAVSYGAFFVSKTQERDNKLLSGCFNTTFTENSSSINMNKALPMSNEKGLNTTPYTFTLSNTCSVNAEYYVILNVKDNSFSDEYISYNYSGNETKVLNTATENTLFEKPTGYSKSYILTNGTLKNGRSVSYNIKLWLNNNADYASMTGKTWQGEIKVISVPDTNQTHPDMTIAYTYNNEPSNTPLSTYLAGVVNKTYTANVTCTNGAEARVTNEGKVIFDTLPTVTDCTINFKEYPIQCVDDNGNTMTCPSTLAIGQRMKIGDQYFRYIRTTNTSDTTHTYNECNDGGSASIACTDADSRHPLENNQLRLLAEYNLNVGAIYNSSGSKISDVDTTSATYGKQDSTARGWVSGQNRVGTVAYGSSNNNYSQSNVKTYTDNYASYLNTTYFSGSNEVSGSAITLEELKMLGCDPSNWTCNGAPNWVYTSSYWSGSPYSTNYVWFVRSDAYLDGTNYNIVRVYGVRAVISISASSI